MITKKTTSLAVAMIVIMSNLAPLAASASELEKVEANLAEEQINLQADQSIDESTEVGEDQSVLVADVTAPEIDIDSFTIDKSDVKPGETIQFSIKASDDLSGVSSVMFWYIMPDTNKQKRIDLYYNNESNQYEGTMAIDESIEAGEWKIYSISVYDRADNSTHIYNSKTVEYMENRVDLSMGNFTVDGTKADITAPEVDIDSLTVDKTDVKPGDTIQFSIKASDDLSGVSSVMFWYIMPDTNKQKRIDLYYNSESNQYEGTMAIDESIEAGEWKIYSISVYDRADNSTHIYNSKTVEYMENRVDLSLGNFTVDGTKADITAPEVDIDSLTVDKSDVKPGDTIQFSIKASDDLSGVSSVMFWYIMPDTNKQKRIDLYYNSESNQYEGTMAIDESIEAGEWKIYSISVYDRADNSTHIYNSKTVEYMENRIDLSLGNFTVKNDDNPFGAIEGVEVITSNQSWSNKTVVGDVYIGPDAVLTLSNVTITGNVYVLGALRSYGGLTINGNLEGTSMNWGGSATLYNGTIVLSGSNSISSINVSNYPVQDLPLRIDTDPLVAEKGKISFEGATVNVADMYVEDQKVTLDYKGRFSVEDIFIGNKDTISIKFITVFGNEIHKEVAVDQHIDKLPVITGVENVTVGIGDQFDRLAGIKATDQEDGDLTHLLTVSGTVDTNEIGVYSLTYTVTDTDGNTTTVVREVTVRSNEEPVLTGVEDVVIHVGDTFDPMSGIGITDVEDGTVPVEVEGEVDTTTAGTYFLTYTATDTDGNTITVKRTVVVKLVVSGSEFVDNTLLFNDVKIMTLPNLSDEQLQQLVINGETVKLSNGTLQYLDHVLIINNGEYEYHLNDAKLTVKKLQNTQEGTYAIEYKPVLIVDLLTGVSVDDHGMIIGSVHDVIVNDDGTLAFTWTQFSGAEEGFGPDGEVMPEVDAEANVGEGPNGVQMPGLEAGPDMPEEGLGPDGEVMPEVDAEANVGEGPNGVQMPTVDSKPQADEQPTDTVKPDETEKLPQAGDAQIATLIMSGVTTALGGLWFSRKRRK